MTALTKPVTRRTETAVRDQGRRKRLVVTIHPNGTLSLRPERTRREETVTLEAIYSLAIKQRVAKEQAEKKKQKKTTENATMSRIWVIAQELVRKDKAHLRHQYTPQQIRRIELTVLAVYFFVSGVGAGWLLRGWMR